MEHKNIYIPQGALEETIQVCTVELQSVSEKQCVSIGETLFRFLKMDLQLYMKVALLGLCVMLAVCMMIPDVAGVPFTIYFGLLGCLNIYEAYKNITYKTSELYSPVYLNQGRVLLLKNASAAVFGLLTFFIFALFAKFVMHMQIITVLLGGLLPLLCSQILILHIMKYIHQVFEAFVIYVLLFVVYAILYYQFEMYLLERLNMIFVIGLCISVFALLCLDLWFLNKKRKGDDYGITFGAY